MARVIRREIRKRGFFGWVFLTIFLLFNLLMLVWLISYFNAIGEQFSSSSDGAHQAGTAIGGGIGTTFILGFWMIGSVITGLLALLTRGGKTVIEEIER